MMHRVKARLAVQAVKKPYDPKYPASLSDDELVALLKTRGGSPHLRAAALIACLGSSLAAQETQPASRPSSRTNREVRICSLLNTAMAESRIGHWFHSSLLERREIAGLPGRTAVTATVPISYGNSFTGLFDADNARRNARRVFAAYGIHLEPDVTVDADGARGIIDGYAKNEKIGFELRTEDLDMEQLFTRDALVKTSEDGEKLLDEREITALESSGKKIFFAPQSFYVVFDDDEALPMVYWMAAVVDFLNSVTDGPDIDIASALSGDFRRRSAPIVIDSVTRKNLESRVERRQPSSDGAPRTKDATTSIVLDGPTRIRLLVERDSSAAPDEKAERRDGETAPPPSTRPSRARFQPSMISIAHFTGTLRDEALGARTGQDEFAGQVTGLFQRNADGSEVSVRLGTSGLWTYFVPSAIDLNLPFEIEIEIPSGRSAIPNSVYIR